jgi:hypothetical protein
MTRRLKAGRVEPEETYNARQWLGKQISAATDTQATIEQLLGTMCCSIVIFGVCDSVRQL